MIYFTSPSCGPCRQLKKDLDNLGLLDRVTQVDVSQSDSVPLVTTYGVRSVPTMVILDDDEEIIKVRVGYTGDLRDLEGLIQ